MKNILYKGAVMTALMIPVAVSAQQDSTQKEKMHVKLGVYYNSHLNYYGRTDSLRSSGVFPMAELWFTKSLYVNAAPVFVHNAAQNLQYNGTVTTLGYLYNHNNKYSVHVYAVKPFYKRNSELVQSALKAQVATSFTIMTSVVNVTAGGDMKFSDHTDYGATAGLDHIFRTQLGNNTVLVIAPSVYMYAGTQQFSKSYLQKTPGFLFFPGSEQTITQSSARFSVLSYELSAPVVLAKNKFQLILLPAWVLPQNLISVAGRPDLLERGSNIFYITVGGKITF